MKITEDIISIIEKALGYKLYDNQKLYLLNEDQAIPPAGGRGTGKTIAYCIRLALSEGEPLDLRNPGRFSDETLSDKDANRRYARYYFLDNFMHIRSDLKHFGFPVREVRRM